MGVVYGGQPCIDPRFFAADCARPGLPTNWYGLPNGFLCPIGTSPGVGYLLLTRRSLDALDLNKPYDLSFDITDETTGKSSSVTLKNLLVLRTVCLSPSFRGDPDGCHLVRLTDLRHQHAAVPVDKAYNVRSAPGVSTYYSATLNGSTAWTWDGVVRDLWNAVVDAGGLPRLGNYPGLPYAPLGTPENLRFYRSYALKALGQVLGLLNCAIDWNPVTDKYTIVNTAAPDAAADAALSAHDFPDRVWDAEPLEPARARYPYYCRVAYLKSLTTPDATGGNPYYYVDVPDPQGAPPGVEPGTYAVLDDPLQALYDSGGNLTNTSALYARAQALGQQFFASARAGRLDRTFAGMLPDAGLLPGSQVKATWWGDAGAGYQTRVLRFPGEMGMTSAGAAPAVPGAGGGGGLTLVENVENVWDMTPVDAFAGCDCLSGSVVQQLFQQIYTQLTTYQQNFSAPTTFPTVSPTWTFSQASSIWLFKYLTQLTLQFQGGPLYLNAPQLYLQGGPVIFQDYFRVADYHVTWNADQVDYALPDACTVLIVDLTANVTLKSIAGGQDGRLLWIVNKSNAHTLTLSYEDAAGTAAGRMRLPSAANVALGTYEGVGLKYDAADARWYCLDEAGGSTGFTNPMTTLGDLIYEDATPAAVRLAGNTTTTRKFLRQTGTGAVSAAPAWDTLQTGDVAGAGAAGLGDAWWHNTGTTGGLGERWYICGQKLYGTLSNFTPTASVLYAVPFRIDPGVTIDRIGFRLPTGTGTGGKVHFGVYQANGTTDLYPGALVFDSGELTIAGAGGAGVYAATVSQALSAGKLYWAVMLINFGPNVATLPSSLCDVCLGWDNTLSNECFGLSVSQTYGALPNTFPAGASLTPSSLPAICVRYSA